MKIYTISFTILQLYKNKKLSKSVLAVNNQDT